MANMAKMANVPIGPGCENGQTAKKTRVAKMTKRAEKVNLAKYSKKTTKTQMNKKWRNGLIRKQGQIGKNDQNVQTAQIRPNSKNGST